MQSFSTTRILLVALCVVVAAAFLPLWVTGYILGLLTIAYYTGVFAMSWDLLFGFAGEVNFGPTFLIGTGAYTAGILDTLYQPPIWLCVAAGTIAAVVGGVVLALPALRVRGPYFGLTTLVAVLMLENFIIVDAHLTGGENGLAIPDVISISDTVNYEITIDDATTWTRPWTVLVPMTRNQETIYEYTCHEGNYGMFGILTGARAQEKAADEAARKGSR